MQATAHATSSRLQGRAENATRERDEEQRYSDAPQDGRSGEPGLPGERARGEERLTEKKKLGRERDPPHERFLTDLVGPRRER